MAQEFEVKYRSSPETLAALAARFGPCTPITMETVYYDSLNGSLSMRKWTLRRRLENGVSVCTLKTPGQGLARGEWEVRCPDIREAVPMLLALGAPAELEGLTAGGIVERCAARFVRQAAQVRFGTSTLELALDQGILLGGGKEIPLCEVEAELKEGLEADALAFGEAIAAEYGLEPEEKSKAARAMALAAETA